MVNAGDIYGFSIEYSNTRSLFYGFSVEYQENLIVLFRGENGELINSIDELTIDDGSTQTTLHHLMASSYSLMVEVTTSFVITARSGRYEGRTSFTHSGGADPQVETLRLAPVPCDTAPPTFSGVYQFLSTKPKIRRLSMDDPEYLFFCALQEIQGARLFVRSYFSNTTTHVQSLDLGTLHQGITKCIDVGFSSMGYLGNVPVGSFITKIDMYIGMDETDESGDKITYIPYIPDTDHKLLVYYVNSAGGLDSLVCEGDRRTTMDSDHTIAKRAVSKEAAQFVITNSKGQRKYDVNTGAMPNRSVRALMDMAIKKPISILQEINCIPTFSPVLLVDNSMRMPSDMSNEQSLSFTLQDAYENTAIDRVV